MHATAGQKYSLEKSLTSGVLQSVTRHPGIRARLELVVACVAESKVLHGFSSEE